MGWYLNQHLKTVCSYDLFPAQTLCQVLRQIQHLAFILDGKPGPCGLSHKPLKSSILPYTKSTRTGDASHIKQVAWSPGTNFWERRYILNLVSSLLSELNQASSEILSPFSYFPDWTKGTKMSLLTSTLIWNKIPWKCLHSSSNGALALSSLPGIAPST